MTTPDTEALLPVTLAAQLGVATDLDACFCIACGQPDEDGLHDPTRCAGMGGTNDRVSIADALTIFDQSCADEPDLEGDARALHCAIIAHPKPEPVETQPEASRSPVEASPNLVPFPKEFPHAGEYIVWSRTWDRIGYADSAQYPGQQPIRFPEDATPLECFLGGYIKHPQAPSEERRALELARPIVEADLASAEDHNDADWEGMSRTALVAIDSALARFATDTQPVAVNTSPDHVTETAKSEQVARREAVLKILDPKLFSDDPIERHQAASPLIVEAAQAPLIAKANAILTTLEASDADTVRVPSMDNFKSGMHDDQPFIDAWQHMERLGFMYGDDALENVHLGWQLARLTADTLDTHKPSP